MARLPVVVALPVLLPLMALVTGLAALMVSVWPLDMATPPGQVSLPLRPLQAPVLPGKT